MKVLELFCGTGSWSKPFLANGHKCVGVDITQIKYSPYPSDLIIQDISTLNGEMFKNFDFIIGSPPCSEFSIAKQDGKRDVEKGLILVNEFMRIVKESNIKYWAFENVQELEKYYKVKPKWRFMVSKGGKRSLWANFNFGLMPHYQFKRKIEDIGGSPSTRWQRAIIPHLITKAVYDVVIRL